MSTSSTNSSAQNWKVFLSERSTMRITNQVITPVESMPGYIWSVLLSIVLACLIMQPPSWNNARFIVITAILFLSFPAWKRLAVWRFYNPIIRSIMTRIIDSNNGSVWSPFIIAWPGRYAPINDCCIVGKCSNNVTFCNAVIMDLFRAILRLLTRLLYGLCPVL